MDPTSPNNNFLIYAWISLIIVLMLLTSSKREIKENFLYNTRRYCGNCGYNSRSECANCVDCGYCISKYGYGECLPGDSRGPYFRDDCAHWEYNSPFSYYYTYPYPHLFPILSIGDYYPYYFRHINRKRLNKKHKRRYIKK